MPGWVVVVVVSGAVVVVVSGAVVVVVVVAGVEEVVGRSATWNLWELQGMWKMYILYCRLYWLYILYTLLLCIKCWFWYVIICKCQNISQCVIIEKSERVTRLYQTSPSSRFRFGITPKYHPWCWYTCWFGHIHLRKCLNLGRVRACYSIHGAYTGLKQSSYPSKDWFKGKFTGKPHIYWENQWFPVKIFPQTILYKSMISYISMYISNEAAGWVNPRIVIILNGCVGGISRSDFLVWGYP